MIEIPLRPMSERPEVIKDVFLFSKEIVSSKMFYDDRDIELYKNCLSAEHINNWQYLSYYTGWLYADEISFTVRGE